MISGITNICDEDVKKSPLFEDLSEDIMDFIE
jgi:DNA polymerase III epsilon subunit-like protein